MTKHFKDWDDIPFIHTNDADDMVVESEHGVTFTPFNNEPTRPAKITTAFIRDVTDQHARGEISYSKMVELIDNEARRVYQNEPTGTISSAEEILDNRPLGIRYSFGGEPIYTRDECIKAMHAFRNQEPSVPVRVIRERIEHYMSLDPGKCYDSFGIMNELESLIMEAK